MITSLRRLFWLALLGGAGYALWTAWQRQKAPEPDAPPEWPPIDSSAGSAPAEPQGVAEVPTPGPPGDSSATPPRATPGTARSAEVRWVEPVDGVCPDGYPVKANDNSMIFHMPGGRFYDRTVPERCYADAADAEADGYRRSKA